MVDHTGEQFGNYRLVHLLGRGGFADVYLGEHIRLKTQAAIKILYTQLTGKEEGLFFKEAYTIAHLEHQHIVRILDFDVREGVPFLVMNYAAGGTLRQRHPKGSILTAAAIVPYLQQVTDALQYAHSQKIIHRDIKPENMLLGRDGRALLSDFGLALVLQSSHQTTQEVAGTVSYMAPEQLQGHPHPASDQYALGVVVYQWLCGSCPFQGSFTEIASQHVLTPPPPLRTKQPAIAPTIEQVVMTTLAKEPQHRFASVHEFCSAFERACRNQTASKVVNMVVRPDPPLPASTSIMPAGQPVFSSRPEPATAQTPSSQQTEALQPPSPCAPIPVQRQSPSPVMPGAPPASHVLSSSAVVASRKKLVPRWAALIGMAIAIVALGGIVFTWLSTATVTVTGTTQNVSITGPIQSVNAIDHSITVRYNNQLLTINGLTDAEVAQLQANIGKTYTIEATQNADGSYTIVKGSKLVVDQQSSTAANAPGSIDFFGKVQSSSANSITVSMPNGDTLTMSITSQTNRSDFANGLPTVGQQIKVQALANLDGSFSAKTLAVITSDSAILNTVDFQGVTTSPVGTDNVLHFNVGTKSYSYTMTPETQMKDFANAQSIGANQPIMVAISFNGSNGSVVKVARGL